MSRRSVLLSAVIAASLPAASMLAPVPALAREAAHDAGLHQVTQKLADPRLQRSIAGALAALTEALMDIKVAPFANAMAQIEAVGENSGANGRRGAKLARQMDPNTTLRDLAGPGGANISSEIDHKLPQMMTALSGMSGAVETVLPQLEEIAKRVEQSIPVS